MGLNGKFTWIHGQNRGRPSGHWVIQIAKISKFKKLGKNYNFTLSYQNHKIEFSPKTKKLYFFVKIAFFPSKP